MRRYLSRLVLTLLLFSLHSYSEEPLAVTVDLSKPAGEIRALHGGNCGPLNYGELTDLSSLHRELAMPLTRLHDCHWPNPDVVDIHTIFTDFDADPAKPESYDFRRTDDYIKAIPGPILYRLGESIEHSKRKYFVHPPPDREKWAAICLGIIRHYNEGWAGGMKLNIQHWEIWNEPENRPAMWSGTDDDYFALYETAAKAIKAQFPALKVGGPSVGYTGKIQKSKFEPGEFIAKFVARCKDKSIPLDFLSWHLYTNDPLECTVRGRGIRELLDRNDMQKCESHFNEWNYLPGNDWKPMTIKNDYSVREKFYDRIGSAEGAAFTICALINMQDAPIDMANYYMTDNQGFGITTFHGVPRKNFYALKAFRLLTETPLRLHCSGLDGGKAAIAAGLNREKTEARVLIGNLNEAKPIRVKFSPIPWPEAKFDVIVVNDSNNLTSTQKGKLTSDADLLSGLKAPYVALIRITPQ